MYACYPVPVAYKHRSISIMTGVPKVVLQACDNLNGSSLPSFTTRLSQIGDS